MFGKLKKYFKSILTVAVACMYISSVKATYIIDKYHSGYLLKFDPVDPDILLSTSRSMLHKGIKAIFNVKFKNTEKKIIYATQVFLRFDPDISNQAETEELVRIILRNFPGSSNFNVLLLERMMRFARTPYYPAIVNVHAIVCSFY